MKLQIIHTIDVDSVEEAESVYMSFSDGDIELESLNPTVTHRVISNAAAETD